MSKKRLTQQLPQDYQQVGQFDLNENQGLALILTLTGIGLLFGVGWLLLRSLVFLRPEYLSTENILIITGMREFWRSILLLVVTLGLMVILNESIRGSMLWLLTGQKPKLSFKGFSTHASAPECYIPRRAYLIIRLTPLLLITLFGLAAVPIVSLNFVPGVLLLVSLNFASALGDMVIAYWLLRKPSDILVMDYGDGVLVYHHDEPNE